MGNVVHTIKSLDQFRFPGLTQQVFNIQNEINNGTRRVVYGSTPHQLSYQDPHHANARYFTETNGANVVTGSTQVFTCKHGFYPYFNAVVAKKMKNWEPKTGREFSCICEEGKWICNASCRCLKYCEEE